MFVFVDVESQRHRRVSFLWDWCKLFLENKCFCCLLPVYFTFWCNNSVIMCSYFFNLKKYRVIVEVIHANIYAWINLKLYDSEHVLTKIKRILNIFICVPKISRVWNNMWENKLWPFSFFGELRGEWHFPQTDATVVLKEDAALDVVKDVKVTWHTAKNGDLYSEFVLCIYPILSAHTHARTHTHTHPRCLAQGHLSRGIEGGERAVHSLPPPTIPAANLWVTSQTL